MHPLHAVVETIIHNIAECIIISRSYEWKGESQYANGRGSLARFLYCLRAIVSIIVGQRPRRRQYDTSRCFFPCASCARRATLQSYLIRHERNVLSPCKQLFPFVGEIDGIFPRRIVPLYCTVYSRLFMRSVNEILRFTWRTIVRFDRFWRYIPWKWKLARVVTLELERTRAFFFGLP